MCARGFATWPSTPHPVTGRQPRQPGLAHDSSPASSHAGPCSSSSMHGQRTMHGPPHLCAAQVPLEIVRHRLRGIPCRHIPQVLLHQRFPAQKIWHGSRANVVHMPVAHACRWHAQGLAGLCRQAGMARSWAAQACLPHDNPSTCSAAAAPVAQADQAADIVKEQARDEAGALFGAPAPARPARCGGGAAAAGWLLILGERMERVPALPPAQAQPGRQAGTCPARQHGSGM